MTVDRLKEQNRTYMRQAKKRLEELGKEIKELRQKPSNKPETTAKDWQATVSDLKFGLTGLRRQLGALTDGSEQPWSDVQARIELGMWDLRAAVQRTLEGTRPLLAYAAGETTRYYLQTAEQGRWGLQREGTGSAVKYFDSKAEALRFSRRYVRQRSPSELIVRRRDGTFQAVHRYR